MLVAVVSDTHNDRSSLDRILKCTKSAEALLHLGDNVSDAIYLKERFKGEVYYVRGNCDGYNSAPKELVLEFKGKRLLLTHGDHYGVKISDTMLKFEAEEKGVDAALYGHTHMPSINDYGNIMLINPGSAALPRMSKSSIAFMEIEEGKRLFAYIYNL